MGGISRHVEVERKYYSLGWPLSALSHFALSGQLSQSADCMAGVAVAEAVLHRRQALRQALRRQVRRTQVSAKSLRTKQNLRSQTM